MEENRVEQEQESVATPEQSQEDAALEQSAPEGEQAEQADEPKPKSLKGLIQYIKTHENLRQVVLFTLFSMICGATQMLITFVLPIILRAAAPEKMGPGTGYDFFVFYYKEPGMAEFIGFLVGSVWGQTLTFILNRKKTFNVRDHIAFRAIAYAVMAVLIIIAQTAIGGAITTGFKKGFPEASEQLIFIYNLVGQVVAGLAAFTMSFLGNKFVIMRKFGKGKEMEQLEKSAPDSGEAQEEVLPQGESDEEIQAKAEAALQEEEEGKK